MPKKGPKLPTGMASIDVIPFPKAPFKNFKNLLCVDYGGSLVKIMFITQKDVNTDPNNYVFTCVSYKRTNMKECYKWMKEHIQFNQVDRMIMTGMGGNTIKDGFVEQFKLQIDFVPELPAQCKGLLTMIENMPREQIFFEKESPTIENMQPSALLKELLAVNGEPPEQGDWPVMFIYAGAATVIMKLNQDATYEIIGTSMTSGKSLMGLCSLLTNTGEYEEIAPLAAKGDRKGLDTQVLEMFKDPIGSTYATYPPEFPIFSFGKAGDHNKSLYKYKRTDLATSAVFFVTSNLAHELVTLCRLTKLYKVIIGGTMFKDSTMRKFLMDCLALLKMENTIHIDFVNTGHTGALGAMIMMANAS